MASPGRSAQFFSYTTFWDIHVVSFDNKKCLWIQQIEIVVVNEITEQNSPNLIQCACNFQVKLPGLIDQTIDQLNTILILDEGFVI